MHDAQISSAVTGAGRRLQDAEAAFEAAMLDGMGRLARLSDEETQRMVGLWYIFGPTFTLTVVSVPPYLAGQLINGNASEMCSLFRPQRLSRIDVAEGADPLLVLFCPPLTGMGAVCSLRWLLVALLVLAVLVLCASCCCGAWIVVEEREGRVGRRKAPERIYTPPEPSYGSMGARRVVRAPAPQSTPVKAGGVVATLPSRRPSRPGKIDPIAEHLENADEDMQDLQSIKLRERPSLEAGVEYELPYSTYADRLSYAPSADASMHNADGHAREGRSRAHQLLMLAIASSCLFILALLALIFSASGVSLVFDEETVCRTPW